MEKQIGLGELLQTGTKATKKQKRQPVPYPVRVGKSADADKARDRAENNIGKEGHSLNTGHLFG